MQPLPNLTRRYLAILGVAALLAAGGQALVQAALHRQTRHYGLVGHILRSRALTTRAVQSALALGRPAADSAGRAAGAAELATTTAQLWREAGVLQPAATVAAAPRSARAALASRMGVIERARADLLAATSDVGRLATAPRADAPALLAATDRVIAAQRPFVAALNDASHDILVGSAREIRALRQLEGAFAVALLSTLVLGGVLVVRPAARTLEALVRELLQSRAELSVAHAEASRERELAASLVAASADGIFAFDRDMFVTEWNPAMERWTGIARGEAVGRRPEDLPAELEWGPAGRPYAAALGGRPTFVQGCRGRLAGPLAAPRYFDVSCVPVRAGDGDGGGARRGQGGEITGGLVTVRDVSERRELEARLSHQAYHDPLTGLANRTRFREQVERALAAGGRGSSTVAVIFVDLDDFKKVNDSLGHAAGDQLLTVVGERLLNATRGSDTVARLGGDEFAILVENARTDDDVLTVADRVVRAMRAPVVLEGREVFVGASVGVARAAQSPEGGALEAGVRAEELLRNADVAMYRAKGAGKGRHVLYESGMLDDALERLELEGELRHAVERGELRLHYQPIVELDGERVTAVEALVRWQHPRLGLVPPARFLSLAEETGLIVPLGRWVLGEACRQVAEWRARAAAQPGGQALSRLGVAVNVSGRQIRDLAFVNDVRDALARTGLGADALLLELPERVFMQCTDGELERLRTLKAHGVRLGIDDFGTGYASLSYLQKFPVDILKIDRSFVEGVTRGGSDAALARAVIALSEMLSVRTVAEGVARPQQQEQLRTLGCALGQGYLFAQPLAADQMDEILGLPPAPAPELAAEGERAA